MDRAHPIVHFSFDGKKSDENIMGHKNFFLPNSSNEIVYDTKSILLPWIKREYIRKF